MKNLKKRYAKTIFCDIISKVYGNINAFRGVSMNGLDEIIILPLDGIRLDGKEIRLGSTADELKAALGEPELVRNSMYYFDSELRFDLGADGKTEFIEFLGGTDGALQPVIYGAPAFKTTADDLYKLLAEKNGGGIDSENDYSYAFLNLSVGVYRESVPSDIEEMIAEAERGGCPMSAEDIAEERKKAAFWATIGLGLTGYYEHI